MCLFNHTPCHTGGVSPCCNVFSMTDALASHVADSLPWILARLEDLVKLESPTEDRAGVNAASALVAEWAKAECGGRPRLHRQKAFGDVLELHFGKTGDPHRPVLLLGHLDTVWPLGTLAGMPWRNVDGRLFGPGVLDMKAGVVMALAALRSLRACKISRPVTFLLNSDEEVGSPISRPITERLAQTCSAVFVLEPAQGLAYKTARKGVGHFELQITGVGAHSGVDFDRGHSAIRELAYQIETTAAFTDPARGLTVNAGVIAGGTRSNIVAASARAEFDVRIARAADAARIERQFRRLKPRDPACTLTLTGGINRPPMERKPGTVALFKQARSLAKQLGFALAEASTGGGSDGNFTAALGVPTLDGMGAVGEGAHAAHESILIEHLVPRTALLAAMLTTTP